MRQNFNFVVQSGCDAPIINTSYQKLKLPFGSGDYPDKLLFHQALNYVSNSSERELPRDMFRFKTVGSLLFLKTTPRAC